MLHISTQGAYQENNLEPVMKTNCVAIHRYDAI